MKGKASRVGSFAVAGLLIVAMFAAMMPAAEARFAPAGNQYDREAMVREAWFALTHQPAPYGPFQQGTLGNWNYLAYDIPSDREVARRFGFNVVNVGWTAMAVINGDTSKGYFDGAGRGGQCLYFVNLLLYRSEADRRQYDPDRVRHYYWPDVNRQAADITTVKAGDVIFVPSSHAAVAVQRSGDSVYIIESNYRQPEKISFRYTTIQTLQNSGYKVYTGVDYYNN